MHAYNRLPSSGHSSPSPPASPRRSPRYRHVRIKPGRFSSPTPSAAASSPRTPSQRIARSVLSLLLRRQGFFLFAPFIYVLCMLFYIGTFSFDIVPFINHRPPPGSVYKTPHVYAKLKPEMDADVSTPDAVRPFFFSFPYILLYFLTSISL